MENLKAWVASPLWGPIGLVVGLLFGYVFYRLGLRNKAACWAIRSNNLVSGFTARLPRLDLRYDQEKIENLTVSKVLIWNSGKTTIDGSDIAQADPVRIEALGNAKLLDAAVVGSNSPPSQFRVSLSADRSAVLLTFDFIDRHQGALLQVIHTGQGSSDVALRGTLKGVRRIRQRNVKLPNEKQITSKTESTPKQGVFVFVFSGLISAGLTAVALLRGDLFLMAGAGVLLVLFVSGALLGYFQFWVPRGLEGYRED